MHHGIVAALPTGIKKRAVEVFTSQSLSELLELNVLGNIPHHFGSSNGWDRCRRRMYISHAAGRRPRRGN